MVTIKNKKNLRTVQRGLPADLLQLLHTPLHKMVKDEAARKNADDLLRHMLSAVLPYYSELRHDGKNLKIEIDYNHSRGQISCKAQTQDAFHVVEKNA